MSRQAQLTLVTARYSFYRLLQLVFSYPTKQLVDMLQDGSFIYTLEILMKELRISETVLIELKDELNEKETDAGELLQQMEIEYTRLFINAYPKAAVGLYASLHWNKQCVFSDPVEFWRKAKVALNDRWNERSDHLVAELGFMGYLIEKELEQKNRIYYTLQNEFLERHFLKWLPAFCAKLTESAESKFYKIISRITMDFIEKEVEYLKVS